MKFSSCLSAITFAVAAIASPINFILPRQTQIGNIIFVGSGCPAGTANGGINADGHAFHLFYDDFFALAGSSFTPADNVKHCDVIFSLRCPDGDYMLNVNTRALSSLTNTNSVHVKTVITYPTGASATSNFNRAGPEIDDYAINHPEFASNQFPCGRVWIPFKISSTITLTKGASDEDGYWGISSIDAGLNLI